MKKIFYTLVSVAMAFAVVSCDEQYITYNGPEYMMF